jgi:aminoglycoside 2'-N-acetyltransferase I
VLAPDGLRRTEEDDDGVFVLPVPGTPADLDPRGDLACDGRDGDAW